MRVTILLLVLAFLLLITMSVYKPKPDNACAIENYEQIGCVLREGELIPGDKPCERLQFALHQHGLAPHEIQAAIPTEFACS